MYPRLRPPQRGQTNPFGHRCAVRCSPHRTSSPKRERNSLTVMMGFLFNRLGFFMSDIISPFIRLIKLDIHLDLFHQSHFDWAKRQVPSWEGVAKSNATNVYASAHDSLRDGLREVDLLTDS